MRDFFLCIFALSNTSADYPIGNICKDAEDGKR